jgi:hypothetical protein
MAEYRIEEKKEKEEFKCRYMEVSEDGRLICTRIKQGDNIISQEVCTQLCPLPKEKCIYLKFSLRKETLFSAIGVGGRRTEMSISTIACFLHKRKIDNLSECETCKDRRYELKDEALLKVGYKILMDNLGEEKTKEFLRLFLEKKII